MRAIRSSLMLSSIEPGYEAAPGVSMSPPPSRVTVGIRYKTYVRLSHRTYLLDSLTRSDRQVLVNVATQTDYRRLAARLRVRLVSGRQGGAGVGC